MFKIGEITLSSLALGAQHDRSVIGYEFEPTFPPAVLSQTPGRLRGIDPAIRELQRGVKHCENVSHAFQCSKVAATNDRSASRMRRRHLERGIRR